MGKVVGFVGYVNTPRGDRALTTVMAGHLDDSFKRSLYKNFYKSKKKAYTKYSAKYAAGEMEAQITRAKKYCSSIRAIVHTQPSLVKNLGRRKAHVKEIQVNGGSVEAKVDYVKGLFESDVRVSNVFSQKETPVVDILSVTKGRGVDGVITRWGVSRL